MVRCRVRNPDVELPSKRIIPVEEKITILIFFPFLIILIVNDKPAGDILTLFECNKSPYCIIFNTIEGERLGASRAYRKILITQL